MYFPIFICILFVFFIIHKYGPKYVDVYFKKKTKKKPSLASKGK